MSAITQKSRPFFPQNKKEWLVLIKILVAAATFFVIYTAVPNALPAAVGAACSITHTVSGLQEFKTKKRKWVGIAVHIICALLTGFFVAATYQFVPDIPDALTDVKVYSATLAGVLLSLLSYCLTFVLDPAPRSAVREYGE